MSVVITITSITANTPVDIYYCDSLSANCVFVTSTSVIPYQFTVPPPYSDQTFIVKIIDSQTCESVDPVIIQTTPTPTQTETPTPTQTETPTSTSTSTPTQTQTETPTSTSTSTPNPTPTNTPTQLVCTCFGLISDVIFSIDYTDCYGELQNAIAFEGFPGQWSLYVCAYSYQITAGRINDEFINDCFLSEEGWSCPL